MNFRKNQNIRYISKKSDIYQKNRFFSIFSRKNRFFANPDLSKVQTKFAPDQKGYYSYLTIGYDKKKLRLSPLIVTTYTVLTLRIFKVHTTWHYTNNKSFKVVLKILINRFC